MNERVKCKSYFWGFCKEKPIVDNETKTRGCCDLEECKKFKIEK